ncbi:MAG: hypothetical protein AB8G99_16220 [Planctomycetaceae bacterium]
MTTPTKSPMRKQLIVTGTLALLILIPSMLGFADKFYQLVLLCKGEAEGAFAITPVVNYLLASFGFLCLLVWATMNGMFSDIERPKTNMLDTESRLDATLDPSRTREANGGQA